MTSLTCAVDSISLKASITGAFKATKSVIAGSSHMTVVHLSSTLIDIYEVKKQQVSSMYTYVVHNLHDQRT